MSEKEVTDFVAASELPEQTLPSEKDIIQLALLIKSRNFSIIQKFIILDPTLREGHLDTLLRAIILSQLGLGQATNGHVSGVTQINPKIRVAVYRIVTSMGQEEDYNIKIHEDAYIQEEQCRIQRSGPITSLRRTRMTKMFTQLELEKSIEW